MSDLVRRARLQHGLMTVDQLRALGVSRSTVRSHLDCRDWTVVTHGVLRIGGAPVTRESQVMAHVLAAGSQAIASHRTAAALWGLDGHTRGTPELTTGRNRQYRPRDARVHVSTDLHLIRPVRRSGIPTTPITRTLLDLGAVTSPGRVHVALDDARRRGLTSWDALLTTLVAHARRGRPGVAVLRSIVDSHFGEVAVTESGFERLVIIALRQAGLPPPSCSILSALARTPTASTWRTQTPAWRSSSTAAPTCGATSGRPTTSVRTPSS